MSTPIFRILKNIFNYLWFLDFYVLSQDSPITAAHNPDHQRNRESGGHPEGISPLKMVCLIFYPWRSEMPSAHRRPDIGVIDLGLWRYFVH
jgi:hypothetical protein